MKPSVVNFEDELTMQTYVLYREVFAAQAAHRITTDEAVSMVARILRCIR